MDGRIAEAFFDILDRRIELHFRIGNADLPDAFRVHEDDVLDVTDEQPEDKVGVEVASFKKANAFSFAQVSQQIKFLAFEEASVIVVEVFQVFDKCLLATV